MPAPGDDDDIIIHRVQHNTQTDVANPVTMSRVNFHAICAAVNTGSLTAPQGVDLNAMLSLSS